MRLALLVSLFIVHFTFLGQSLSTIHSNTSSIQNYLPKDYGGNPQVFSIVQDNRGVMYFANQLGVVQYDGISWKIINTNNKEVFNLSLGEDGTVYVLCNGDFGVLIPNSKGEPVFQSRLDLFSNLIGDNKNFNNFSNILFHNKRAYVHVNNQLYTIKNDTVNVVSGVEGLVYIKKIDDELYLQLKKGGLYTLRNNELNPIKGGNRFNDKKINGILKFNSTTYILTKRNGIFRLDKDSGVQFVKHFKSYSINSALNNRDLYLILGTTEGILLLDKNLNTYKIIGVTEGLTDGTIKSQYLDTENNLWIGSQIGISKVEIDIPIELFNKSNSLNGSIEDIGQFYGTIFCATQNGVYYLGLDGNAIKIPKLETDCYGLYSAKFGQDSLLLVAEVNGVYQIDKEFKVTKISSGGPYSFCRSPLNRNEVFVVHYDGISNLLYEDGNLKEQHYETSFTKGEPFNFLIQEDGTIWIGTLHDGIYQTNTKDFKDSVGYVHYDFSSGLPNGPSYLFEYNNEIYAGTDEGVYWFSDGQFNIIDKFNLGSGNSKKGVHRINADKTGKIWAVLFDKKNKYDIGYSLLKEKSYSWKNKDFLKYSDELIHAIFHDSKGMTWLGGPSGLIKYDPNFKKRKASSYHCLIRKISIGDSLLFGGFKGNLLAQDSSFLNLDFIGNNPINIEFSASTYIDESKTYYSFFLEGFDKKWSDWSLRNYKEYHLKEGTYTFYVKARNILGEESDTVFYTIKIAPPWYRTKAAIVIYILLFIALIYFIIKLSLLRVKRQNKKLENIVTLRTKEVLEQKVKAEKQRDIIGEKNREIMDSINYAKRIQSAILPPDEMFHQSFTESFVLYKPKDVVAGDFYWLQKVQNKIIFAAADCTGHGVPGAMVSVVCNNALNRSVREYGLTVPGEILDRTRSIVIQEFEKSDEDVKDGMDIALCVLDGKTLQYAGANNPLWIIRNGEIIETKANKQPIGQFENLKAFTTHTFELQKGDTVYVFSDGYVDQFGGEKGKKFKVSSLRTLLLSIQDNPMKEQGGILNKTFNDWKGSIEQIDDVCFIGFKY